MLIRASSSRMKSPFAWLDMQNETLNELHSRTGVVIAAAIVASAFLGAAALQRQPPEYSAATCSASLRLPPQCCSASASLLAVRRLGSSSFDARPIWTTATTRETRTQQRSCRRDVAQHTQRAVRVNNENACRTIQAVPVRLWRARPATSSTLVAWRWGYDDACEHARSEAPAQATPERTAAERQRDSRLAGPIPGLWLTPHLRGAASAAHRAADNQATCNPCRWAYVPTGTACRTTGVEGH